MESVESDPASSPEGPSGEDASQDAPHQMSPNVKRALAAMEVEFPEGITTLEPIIAYNVMLLFLDVSPDIPHESLVMVRLSLGDPLSESERRLLEPIVGSLPDSVRVHHDAVSEYLTALHRVIGISGGTHIFLGRGQYYPGDVQTMRLLVHEATHVKQWMEGRISHRGLNKDPNTPSEREAYGAEWRFLTKLRDPVYVRALHGKPEEIQAYLQEIDRFLRVVWPDQLPVEVQTLLTWIHEDAAAGAPVNQTIERVFLLFRVVPRRFSDKVAPLMVRGSRLIGIRREITISPDYTGSLLPNLPSDER